MASCFKVRETLTDSLVRKRTYPKAVKGLSAIQVLINPAKDEFTLSSCISGNDNSVGSVEAGADGFQLLECGWIVLVFLIPANLADDKLERIGTDGEVFGF